MKTGFPQSSGTSVCSMKLGHSSTFYWLSSLCWRICMTSRLMKHSQNLIIKKCMAVILGKKVTFSSLKKCTWSSCKTLRGKRDNSWKDDSSAPHAFFPSHILTAFNYDFSKVRAGVSKKRDGERMEDEWVEVCDDSVRNDKETERGTSGFTAPRPAC